MPATEEAEESEASEMSSERSSVEGEYEEGEEREVILNFSLVLCSRQMFRKAPLFEFILTCRYNL